MSEREITATAVRNNGGTVIESLYVVRGERIFRAEFVDGKFKGWQQLPDIPDGVFPAYTRHGADEPDRSEFPRHRGDPMSDLR